MVHDVKICFSSARDPGEIKVGLNEPECRPAEGSKDVVSRSCSSPTAARKVPRREAILILAAAGIAVNAIAYFVQYSVATVRRWIRRGVETNDLDDRRRCGRPRLYSEEIHLRLVAFYCQIRPLAGSGRWTLRWAALHLIEHPERVGVSPSKSTLHRMLKSNKLKPHQSRYFLHISDPDFFPKMEHLIGLYKNPPRNLFFFDESPGIQVLMRLSPDLRTEETKKRLEEFEYIRNGTMDVFAFLNYADGTVYAECQAEHTTPTFLGVFGRHLSSPRPRNRFTLLWTIYRHTPGIPSARWLRNTAEWHVPPKRSSTTSRSDVNGFSPVTNGSSFTSPRFTAPGSISWRSGSVSWVVRSSANLSALLSN